METGTLVFNMFSAMVHNLWDIVAVPVQMLLAIAATSSGVDSTDAGSVHEAVMERVFERHLATAVAPRYATWNSEVDGIGGLRVQTYQDRFCEVCGMSFQMARTFWCATIRRLATVQAWHPGRLSIEAVAFHVMGDETPATFRLRETVAAPIASREVQVRTDYAIAPVQRKHTTGKWRKLVNVSCDCLSWSGPSTNLATRGLRIILASCLYHLRRSTIIRARTCGSGTRT